MGKAANAALKEAPPTDATEWLNFDHPCRGVNRIIDADAGRVELLTPDGSAQRRKFALIGFSTSTRHMAPLNDPEWAVVGMNQLARHLRHAVLDEHGAQVLDQDGKPVTSLRHADLWFEMHRIWNDAVVPGTNHEKWLRECEVPTYMCETVDGLPTSMRFPVERLIKKFDIDYFTSTVSYMIAWAIDHIDMSVKQHLETVPRNGDTPLDVMRLIETIYAEYTIGMFGIDLIVGEEYADQRPAAEYWLGQAMARNINIVLPRKSALLKQHYRYGYDIESPDFLRESDFVARRNGLVEEHRRATEHAIELYGRIAELEHIQNEKKVNFEKRCSALRAEHQKESERAVTLNGAVNELQYWHELRVLRERGGAVE